jgi:hypothetical protein
LVALRQKNTQQHCHDDQQNTCQNQQGNDDVPLGKEAFLSPRERKQKEKEKRTKKKRTREPDLPLICSDHPLASQNIAVGKFLSRCSEGEKRKKKREKKEKKKRKKKKKSSNKNELTWRCNCSYCSQNYPNSTSSQRHPHFGKQDWPT